MKKALVLSLAVILGIGLFASAQTLSGEWYSDLTITGFPAAINIAYTSEVTVSYTVGGLAREAGPTRRSRRAGRSARSRSPRSSTSIRPGHSIRGNPRWTSRSAGWPSGLSGS